MGAVCEKQKSIVVLAMMLFCLLTLQFLIQLQ